MIRFIKVISSIFLVLVLGSCDKKENIPVKKNATKDYQKVRSDYHEKFFKNLRSKTDRVEICLYKLDGNTMSDTTNVLDAKNFVASDELNIFNTVFDTLKSNGYCCCPKTHYTMKLFNKNKMLKRYNVDTIQLKGKVLIYDTNYQTSYIIPLKVWHDLFNQGTTANSR